MGKLITRSLETTRKVMQMLKFHQRDKETTR